MRHTGLPLPGMPVVGPTTQLRSAPQMISVCPQTPGNQKTKGLITPNLMISTRISTAQCRSTRG